MTLPCIWAGACITLGHRQMPMWGGDGTSMPPWVPESVVNIAHIPKELTDD